MSTRYRRRRWTAGLLIPGVLLLASCVSGGQYGSVGTDVGTTSGASGASYITAADIQRYPASTSVEEIIERLAPGIWLRRRHEPGGAISMNMSGLGPPLFVVDGVPVEDYRGTLGLNPRDIAAIEIFKHGGHTSLYGLRGANGVVLITTKRGDE